MTPHVNPTNYIACKNVQGTVLIGNVNEYEAEVKFLHPTFPAGWYYWPKWNNFCIVPIFNIICILDTLNILGM